MKKTIVSIITVTFASVMFMISGFDAEAAGKFGSLADIKAACSTTAVCEDDAEASVIKIDSENPYDVIYDYGKAYDAYVDACDWSLVFDADYYASEFPMLALQYHNDEDLLLMHFQTVGIHEGRQGSKDFNVGAYFYNCDNSIYKAFGKNFAAYYIYYMLNYDAEKDVNTVSSKGHTLKTQYAMVLTWYQKSELKKVNARREHYDADAVKFDSEMAAFANYRAWLNACEGWKAHDWAIQNISTLRKNVNTMTNGGHYVYHENTVTSKVKTSASNSVNEGNYYNSKEHREAMLDTGNAYIGISNVLWNNDPSTDMMGHSQFDIYLNDVLSTPAHP